jgi:hypothetical protein
LIISMPRLASIGKNAALTRTRVPRKLVLLNAGGLMPIMARSL